MKEVNQLSSLVSLAHVGHGSCYFQDTCLELHEFPFSFDERSQPHRLPFKTS